MEIRPYVLLLTAVTAGCSEPAASNPAGELGALRVSVLTTGETLDPDGFIVVLDSVVSRPVGDSGIVTFVTLAAGDHALEISGVAQNCFALGGATRRVHVAAGDTARSDYQVTCNRPFGWIELSTQTRGRRTDVDGYSFALDSGAASPIGADMAVTLGEVSMGSHLLSLTGESANCAVAGMNPRLVDVRAGGTTRVEFDIDCFLLSGELLVQSARGGAWHIYRVRGDGTASMDLTPHTETFEGDWSPDGTRIAFTVIQNQESVIGIMNEDGSNRRLLGVTGRKPTWSPDGTKIAFAAPDGTIRVMNPDGSGVETLTPGGDPDWSPDGSEVAFTRSAGGIGSNGSDIWVMAADGSQPRQLTFQAGASSSMPAWSPDGSAIAFVRRYFFFGPNGLYLMNPDGGSLRYISSMRPPVPPVWSPDGLTLAIAGWPGDPESELAQEVTMIPSTGGGALVIASSPGADYPTSWK
jgi:TolB protein